ncbi:MAG: signal peptidase I [Deltaproteobacteria bacterium]|nr:MAG: signal peptidase I [Deltaproteobacteria bacterium]
MGWFKKKSARREKHGQKSALRDWTEALLVAAVLALIIRTFVVQAFKIPSGSMEDTLLIGDHLLVNKFIYGLQIPGVDGRFLTIREPRRGDIVVFEFPEDREKSFWQRRDFIKRVIGLPGDTVEIRDKKVFVNNQPLVIPEAVFKDGSLVPGGRDNMPPVKVPSGHYFMMGDNRDRSYDSRFWGYVSNAEIKGLAFIKYWSWDSERFLPRWGRIGRLIE